MELIEQHNNRIHLNIVIARIKPYSNWMTIQRSYIPIFFVSWILFLGNKDVMTHFVTNIQIFEIIVHIEMFDIHMYYIHENQQSQLND